jgi:superfamily II DNA or RNA helicase
MELRPYQADIIERTRAEMKAGHKSILIQAPTGAGKTALTVSMLKSAAEKGMPSWFLNHRRELIRQSSKAFAKDSVHHGIIAANFQADPRAPIQVASIQTLQNRLSKVKAPQFIVWDECHHIAAGSWEKIFAAYPNAYHVGLSATPVRLDGRGLGKYFATMVNGPSVAWLIENKYLSKYKLFAPGGINTQGLHTRMGEFVHGELVNLVNKPSITGNAIKEYEKKCGGRRALGFAVSIEHSEYVVAQFRARGISAAHVDGDTPANLRDETLERFEAGEILVVFNCQLFGEGVDLPAVEGLIDLAPTLSLSAAMQRWGRVLRTFPGKDHAIILDHAQNVIRHGLPDEEREWLLTTEGYRNKKDDVNIGVKVCPKCFGAQPARNSECEYCGLVFITKAREVDLVEGDLEEVDPELLRRRARQQQGAAQTEDDLIALGTERGYKRPRLWARHIMMARKKRG